MVAPPIEKVTIFVTRNGSQGKELLLFQHSSAGLQIPAGTIEEGEEPEAAALREGREETGLIDIGPMRYLATTEIELESDRRVIIEPSKVYARPRFQSFDWAHFGRGTSVHVERSQADFTQVTYSELDDLLNPSYLSYCISGWVPNHTLTSIMRRHFFESHYKEPTPSRWEHYDPPHRWILFWAPLAQLPPIVDSQAQWIEILRDFGE